MRAQHNFAIIYWLRVRLKFYVQNVTDCSIIYIISIALITSLYLQSVKENKRLLNYVHKHDGKVDSYVGGTLHHSHLLLSY